MKQRLVWLIPVAIATMACAPGEVERRLTEYPATMICPAVMPMPYVVCEEVRDGKQDCHVAYHPVPCAPDGPSVTTICVPADAAKAGEQQ